MSGGTVSAQIAGSPICWRSGQRGWKRQPVGGLTGDGTSPLRITRWRRSVGSGTGMADMSAWVYGCSRLAEELAPVGQLGDPAEVHHRHPVADVLDDAHVVGDEDVGQPELALELLEQVQDLRLDRDVERRHRLVADDEVGLEDERAGDADALALAAGELVRVAPRVVRLEADQVHHLGDLLPPLGVAAEAVDAQALADAVADRRPRVEAGVRILEDDLHPPPVGLEGGALERGQLRAVELDRARPSVR